MLDREDAARLVRAFYEVMESGRLEDLDHVFDPAWVDHTLPPGRVPGVAGMRRAVAELRTALPDLRAEIHQVLVDGDHVVSRQTVSGTHAGSFAGILPTGGPVEFATFDIHRVVDGHIVESWHLEDNAAVLAQIGAPPSHADAQHPTGDRGGT